MASSIVLHSLRKRPLVSLGVASVTGTVTAASLVEVAANYREKHDPIHTCHLPREYDRRLVRDYWIQRPVSVSKRLGEIMSELTPLLFAYVRDFKLLPQTKTEEEYIQLQQLHAKALREALTNLGPAFVKAGQQLSIRPDLVPAVVLKELQKLCDSVRPISDTEALQVISDELGIVNLDNVFQDMHLVAAASIGQVYKAKLVENGKDVAVKVQRPGMRESFSLDLFLLQQYGDAVDLFTSVFTNQAPFHRALFDNYSHGSYSELDYENEAMNQIHFQKELKERNCKVIVPDVFRQYTSEKVLTTQWIEGIKLADSSNDTIRRLIPVGVELFLTQLLDIGAFHADPHAGNLLVNEDGMLCLLDFGLCATVDPKSRVAMTKAIVHLLQRDFDSLVTYDTKELGFLPEDFDTDELKPLLIKVLTVGLVESGSDLRKRKRKLMEISNELNEIFFRYPFQVPPFFALVTRGLGLLEGIALTGDPDFDIFHASAPYATKRAIQILGSHYSLQSINTGRRKI